MILSHAAQFVFVKGRKVGGTSVELTLSKLCGPSDVVTPLTPRDERVRLVDGSHCRNFADGAVEARYLEELGRRGDEIEKIPMWVREASRYENHMAYRDVLSRTDAAVGSYRAFGVVRDPYAKAVSFAAWRIRADTYRRAASGQPTPSTAPSAIRQEFERMVSDGSVQQVANIDLYRREDGSVVDTIRFESLEADLAALLRDLGVPLPGPLPHAKRGEYERAMSPTELLGEAACRVVEDVCAEEFDHHGYPRASAA